MLEPDLLKKEGAKFKHEITEIQPDLDMSQYARDVSGMWMSATLIILLASGYTRGRRLILYFVCILSM